MIKRTLIVLLLSGIICSLTIILTPSITRFLTVNEPLANADALVLMAGSQDERLPAVAKLYKEGKGHIILLTNDGVFSAYCVWEKRNLFQIEWAEQKLIKLGIPEKDIIKLPHTASGTIHDCLNAKLAVIDKGIKSINIITSDYHTKRTLWTFRRIFRKHPIKIGIYPVHSKVMDLIAVKKTYFISCEMAKYLYYISKYSLFD